MFNVTAKRGFLPAIDPLKVLPEEYKELEKLLQEMPINKADGTKGLLADEALGPAIDSGRLPEYDLTNVTDSQLLHALFRDYTFLASAYLLEPCHKRFLQTGEYGLGRPKLPQCIAVPLCIVAKKLKVQPFMEYALSYALMNWRLVDPTKGFKVENMKLIRAFEGSSDEAGFIFVHVAMVAHSGGLVEAANNMLASLENHDSEKFNTAIADYYSVLSRVNIEMETMWRFSQSAGYNRFRTFIMGIKDQPMFPDGVTYEGVIDGELNPKYSFRGESGANDSMIPLSDNLFQLTEKMPQNPLTSILQDFRRYRPPEHNQYLTLIEQESKRLKVREATLHSNPQYYLLNLDKIREFRTRHWNFAKEYILKHSKHPRATGGSPIVQWLPNQLQAVLAAIVECECDDYEGIIARAREQSVKLSEEVNRLSVMFKV